MGRSSDAPVARQAAMPWRTWATPSSPWPCMPSAHPRTRSRGRPLCKSLRGRERDSGLCLLMHSWHVPAQLMRPWPPNTAHTPD